MGWILTNLMITFAVAVSGSFLQSSVVIRSSTGLFGSMRRAGSPRRCACSAALALKPVISPTLTCLSIQVGLPLSIQVWILSTKNFHRSPVPWCGITSWVVSRCCKLLEVWTVLNFLLDVNWQIAIAEIEI